MKSFNGESIHLGTFIATVLFIISFCVFSAVDQALLGRLVGDVFKYCAQYFGLTWQIIFLLNCN